METFYIEAGKSNPEVILREESEVYYFTGNSFMENPLTFYEPILNWFDGFLNMPFSKDEMHVCFEFNYINTSSTKQIARLLRLFEKSSKVNDIVVRWYYQDDDIDILQVGQRFEQLTGLKFCFRTIENSQAS